MKYESRPGPERRVRFGEEGQTVENQVVMIAHALQSRSEHKVTLSSGFALNVQSEGSGEGETFFVSCAHTLEEVSEPYDHAQLG